MKYIKSSNVSGKLKEILSEGVPKKVQTDEGDEFQGIQKKLSKKYNLSLSYIQSRNQSIAS